MKTLYLLRHAKSCWDDSKLDDFDRPLNHRGLRDAPLMGKRMQTMRVCPDLLLSSPSKRTTATTQFVSEAMGYPTDKIRYEASIYMASLVDLIDLIHLTDNSIENLMIIGHNPGLNSLSHYLIEHSIYNIVTCGLMTISMHLSTWRDLSRKCGTQWTYECPKNVL